MAQQERRKEPNDHRNQKQILDVTESRLDSGSPFSGSVRTDPDLEDPDECSSPSVLWRRFVETSQELRHARVEAEESREKFLANLTDLLRVRSENLPRGTDADIPHLAHIVSLNDSASFKVSGKLLDNLLSTGNEIAARDREIIQLEYDHHTQMQRMDLEGGQTLDRLRDTKMLRHVGPSEGGTDMADTEIDITNDVLKPKEDESREFQGMSMKRPREDDESESAGEKMLNWIAQVKKAVSVPDRPIDEEVAFPDSSEVAQRHHVLDTDDSTAGAAMHGHWNPPLSEYVQRHPRDTEQAHRRSYDAEDEIGHLQEREHSEPAQTDANRTKWITGPLNTSTDFGKAPGSNPDNRHRKRTKK